MHGHKKDRLTSEKTAELATTCCNREIFSKSHEQTTSEIKRLVADHLLTINSDSTPSQTQKADQILLERRNSLKIKAEQLKQEKE